MQSGRCSGSDTKPTSLEKKNTLFAARKKNEVKSYIPIYLFAFWMRRVVSIVEYTQAHIYNHSDAYLVFNKVGRVLPHHFRLALQVAAAVGNENDVAQY